MSICENGLLQSLWTRVHEPPGWAPPPGLRLCCGHHPRHQTRTPCAAAGTVTATTNAPPRRSRRCTAARWKGGRFIITPPAAAATAKLVPCADCRLCRVVVVAAAEVTIAAFPLGFPSPDLEGDRSGGGLPRREDWLGIQVLWHYP
jgi:hypothetical protein